MFHMMNMKDGDGMVVIYKKNLGSFFIVLKLVISYNKQLIRGDYYVEVRKRSITRTHIRI